MAVSIFNFLFLAAAALGTCQLALADPFHVHLYQVPRGGVFLNATADAAACPGGYAPCAVDPSQCCPLAYSICCLQYGTCCPPAYPNCCGTQYCCRSENAVCSNGHCCPVNWSGCTDGVTCCPAGKVCCGLSECCDSAAHR